MEHTAQTAARADTGTADPAAGFAAPWFDLAMAFEVADDGERTWAESLREAAASIDGELLFVLPGQSEGNNDGEYGVVRLDDGGTGTLIFVSREGIETTFADESDADEALAAFARASMTVFDQLRREPAILSPLCGPALTDRQH